MAVNPTNPSNIIVTGVGFSAGDHAGIVRVTSDGGGTWRYGNASYSDIESVAHGSWIFIDSVGTFDASGDAYVGNLATGGTLASFAMRLFKSTDGGNTFQIAGPYMRMNDTLLDYHTGTIVHPCYDMHGPIVDYPTVIADSHSSSPFRNNVYVFVRVGAQVDSTRCAFGTAFERSTDGGKTWGAGLWLGPSYSPPYSPFPSDFALAGNRGMTVSPDGTVLLAGLAYCGRGGATILKSTDGGASFLSVCVAAPFGVDEVEVAAKSADSIYVVFLGESATNAFHLYSVVTHDGGSSWSPVARVDDVTSPDVQHVASAFGPYMWDFSLSPQTGRLDVAWFDWRNNGGNYTLADIYYSYSYDGFSWAANIRATPQGPYYICANQLISYPNGCSGAGNDFMWVASIDDNAYIVASMGYADCGCNSLLARFVTITFPPPPLHVSMFFTDPSLNPLLSDNSGSPSVSVLFSNGIVRATNPRNILAWVNITNMGSTSLQSMTVNDTLPVDWTISPAWMPAKSAIRVYYVNATSPANETDITHSSTITVSTGNPQTIHLTIANLTATAIGHPLMPGQSILVSVKMTYRLIGTGQLSSSYPRSYTDNATATGSTQPSFTGILSTGSGTNFFVAIPKVVGNPHADTNVVAEARYSII